MACSSAGTRTSAPGWRRPPQALVSGLVETTGFIAAIERHTPDLLDEVRGIAEGAGVAFDRILALNLMDEEWWFTAPAEPRDACTLIAVGPADGRPAVLAQNMDLPALMDGAQAIVRHDDGAGSGGTLLTAAGMIGLTGVSSAGLGVCVNTLAMLNHSRDGLPVAFVMRGALAQGSVAGAAAFLGRVPHASGQHYALADPAEVAGYECSAAGAVRSDDAAGRFCHTNHPLRSADVDPAVAAERPRGFPCPARRHRVGRARRRGRRRLRARARRPRGAAVRPPRAGPSLEHVRVDLGRALGIAARADRAGAARPHCLARRLAGLVRLLAPELLEGGPQQARHVHLRDAELFGDLGLGQLEPEAHRHDSLRARIELLQPPADVEPPFDPLDRVLPAAVGLEQLLPAQGGRGEPTAGAQPGDDLLVVQTGPFGDAVDGREARRTRP